MKYLLKLVLAGWLTCILSSCSSDGPSGPDTSGTDTTKLGGVRKLMTGMWWEELENDTIVKVKDTAAITIITRDTVVHHKRSVVTGVTVNNEVLNYTIVISDTVLPQTANPTMSTLVISHSATQVGYTVPPFGWYYRDSVRVKAYDLPLATGKSWQSFTAAGDTSLRVLFALWWVKLRAYYSATGTATVPQTTEYNFGDSLRPCFEIATTTNSLSTIISDSTVILQVGTIVLDTLHQGDTVTTSKTVETGRQFVNTDLSVPLWSYNVQAKCDSNHVNSVVERDTTRKGTWIVSYLDVRIIH
jgi:hypothetical protein